MKRIILGIFMITFLLGSSTSYANKIDTIDLTLTVLQMIQVLQGNQGGCTQLPYNLRTIPIQPRYIYPGYIPNRAFYEVNPPYVEPPINDYEFSMKLQMCRAGNPAFCESLIRRLLNN